MQAAKVLTRFSYHFNANVSIDVALSDVIL